MQDPSTEHRLCTMELSGIAIIGIGMGFERPHGFGTGVGVGVELPLSELELNCINGIDPALIQTTRALRFLEF